MPAIDTVYIDFRNTAGLALEASIAARDGFVGKMAIHPDQVPIINEAFTPSPAEVERAKAIVAAFEATGGAGVVGFEGRCSTARIWCWPSGRWRASRRRLDRATAPPEQEPLEDQQ